MPNAPQDLESFVLDLVDRRLQEYTESLDGHAEILDLDLSQRAFGASIVTDLSTRTKVKPPSTPIWSLGGLLSQRRPVEIATKIPAIVLESQLMLGDCWEFQGRQGHLAIRLPQVSRLTALSVHYFPFHELSLQGQLQAPRTVVVWGLVPSPDVALISSFPEPHRPPTAFLRPGRPLPVGIRPSDVFVRLVEVTFDVHSRRRRQTFNLDYAAHFRFEVVVFEVTDNWGGDSTCTYHVGLHGQV